MYSEDGSKYEFVVDRTRYGDDLPEVKIILSDSGERSRISLECYLRKFISENDGLNLDFPLGNIFDYLEKSVGFSE
jgi:hypothetical protein